MHQTLQALWGNHVAPDEQCWSLESNKDKQPRNCNSKGKQDKQSFDQAVSRQVAKATKEVKAQLHKRHTHKRHVIEESESSSEETSPICDDFMSWLKKLSIPDDSSDEETVSSHSMDCTFSSDGENESHLCCGGSHQFCGSHLC